MKHRMKAGRMGLIGAVISAVAALGPCAQYSDMPGLSDDTQSGRTKNSLAAVVSGIVAQKLYDNAQIDVTIEKSFWPDAKVTGYTTPNSIDTYVDLALTHAHFTADGNAASTLSGNVDKSELDWQVKQAGEDIYEIVRFGLKFNNTLTLQVGNGKVTGTYARTGELYDGKIKGTYDENGKVNIDIDDGMFSLGVTLDGKITAANSFDKRVEQKDDNNADKGAYKKAEQED